MKARESALQTLHRQVDFEISSRVAALATAQTARARAEKDARIARDHNEAVLVALRHQLVGCAINPALVASLKAAYLAGRRKAEALKGKVLEAANEEASRRDALASARHKASYLESALAAESAATTADRVAREAAGLDDMWLSQRLGAAR